MLAGSCVIGATFTLECSSRYWYKERMFDFDIKNFGYFTIMNHSKSRYTYMDVLIKNNTNKKDSISLENKSDKESFRTEIKINGNDYVSLDTKNCIVNHPDTYEEIGWDTAENIYWPRMVKGENSLFVSGKDVSVTLKYKEAHLGLGAYFDSSVNDSSGKRVYVSAGTLVTNGLGEIQDDTLVVTGAIAGDSLYLSN